MTLNEIMDVVHEAYPDGFTRNYWDAGQQRPCDCDGDTLAEFIVKELTDTYDASAGDEEQLEEAIRVMERACGQIGDVIEALQAECFNKRGILSCQA